MDIAINANSRLKVKEDETLDIYLTVARKLMKPWSMKVIVIAIVVVALYAIPRTWIKDTTHQTGE